MSATDRPRLGTSRHVDAEPLQPLEHDAALAQEVVRDHRLRDVGELPRRRIDRALQHRAALGDEHDDVPVGHPLHALDQQLGRDGIDEIGEQDDQRAPLEPRIELGQAEGEIGLLMMVVELGGGALDAAEARHAADRPEILPHRRVETVGADQVAALQRDPGQDQPGIDRMVEPRDVVDRLEHQIAGIERHDDLVIALGAKLLAQELAMPGRMLPVDEAAVEARGVFAQRFELGALPALLLGLDAVDRFLREELQRGALHAAHVGQHVDGAIDADAANMLDQAERSAPAQPDAVDVDLCRGGAERSGGKPAPRARPAGALVTTSAGSISPRCSASRSKRVARRQRAAAMVTVIAPRSPI